MKVDYLSEFGFRLSDYGKYSTIVLFLPPAPRPPLGGAPGRCGRRCRCPRAGRCGAERCPPRPPLRGCAAPSRGAGAAGSAVSPDAGPPPHRNFCWRVRGAGLRAGRSGARGPHQVRRGAVRCGGGLAASFTLLLSLVLRKLLPRPPPLRPRSPGPAEVSRGLWSLRRSFPAARPPRAGAAGLGAGWP